MKAPKLIPIYLQRCFESSEDTTGGYGDHPDIYKNKQYLIKHAGEYLAGKFTRQFYGWCFETGAMLIQLDKPGTNSSEWQALWEIVPPKRKRK